LVQTHLRGSPSGISSDVAPISLFPDAEDVPFGDIAIGDSGDITIDTNRLILINGGSISNSMSGEGNTGDINITARKSAFLSGFGPRFPSGVTSQIDPDGTGNAGEIIISTGSLQIFDGALVGASSAGSGNAGALNVSVTGDITLSGQGNFGPSAITNQILEGGIGQGSDVSINASNLFIHGFAQIDSANAGQGNSGGLNIFLTNSLIAENANISTAAVSGNSGSILISAREVKLRQDSDIFTTTFDGDANAGSITFAGNFVFAFDDSDILTVAFDLEEETFGGRGGNIDFTQTNGFFGQNPVFNGPLPLDTNGRVDVSAVGGIQSGEISTPDISSVENSLNELPSTIIDTATLTAGSCITRTADSQGSFTVTGRDGLPQRPGDMGIAAYPTGTVQTVEADGASLARMHPTEGTLQEPEGVYQLTDGRLVLSRECD
jgi:large exoprotein involved in heme utilization and adhesion